MQCCYCCYSCYYYIYTTILDLVITRTSKKNMILQCWGRFVKNIVFACRVNAECRNKCWNTHHSFVRIMEIDKNIPKNEMILQKYSKLTNDLYRENIKLKNQIIDMQEYFEDVVKHTSIFEMKIKRLERENATLKNKLIEVRANAKIINEERATFSKLLHNEQTANTVAIEEYHKADDQKLVSQLRSLNNMRLLIISIFRNNSFINVNQAFHHWKAYYLRTQNNAICRKQKLCNIELQKTIDKLRNQVTLMQTTETNLRVRLKLAEEACIVLSGL